MTATKRPPGARRTAAPVPLDLFGHPLEPVAAPSRDLVVADHFQDHKVRRIMIDGEPHWVLADVARVLGYASAKDAGRCLKPHHTKGGHSVPTPGGTQSMTLVTLAGLNRLIMRSERPEAEAFQDWVTDEVLPAIQKTGRYDGRRKALDPVEREQKRLKCDQETAVARVKSKGRSKQSHRQLARLNATPNDYREYNNTVYQAMFGRNAAELREVLGQKSGQTPMDRMGALPLTQLDFAKALGDKMAQFQGVTSLVERNKLVEECVVYVRDSAFEQLGGAENVAHAIVEDESRGRILDIVRRRLAAS